MATSKRGAPIEGGARSQAEVDAARIAAQGFGVARSVASALGRGPIRTLGGIDAYLALYARAPGITPDAVHAAVVAGDARVVPAARGCIYLVARDDVPWALGLAEALSAPKAAKEQAKAGIAPGEIATIADAAHDALKAGPMTTDALKKALPSGLVRSLGEAGKKVGIASPLPPALRALEFEGRIERTLQGGRLDSERYLWRRATPWARVGDPAKEAARVFFHAAGVAPLGAFVEWSGLPVAAAKKAVAAAGLEAVTTPDGPALAAPGAFVEAHGAPAKGSKLARPVAFLPFVDNIVALHQGPRWLVDPAHHDLGVEEWGGGRRATTLGRAKHMFMRSVLADDRIVAFWEWDPIASDRVVGFFTPPTKALATRVEAAAGELGGFIRALGHGRSFSLDSDAALIGRCKQIRALT